jgi:CheY-like chemotaxis protein
MATKRILIVDDEEAVLSVLQSSLKKLGPDHEVVTAKDGFDALGQIEKGPFDVVVTDYKMAGMDGLELLEAIRFRQPGARVILITAYGSSALEAGVRRLQAYRYLTKPLELNAFRKIVQKALGDIAISRPGILILSDERYRQVSQSMNHLQRDIAARCIFLTDVSGQIIARTGNPDKLPICEVVSLLGGSIATLREAGHTLDGDADAINLAYREGQKEHLYAVNVGQQLLLVLVIDRTAYGSRLGTVWYYAQQTALSLRQVVGEAEYASPRQVFGEELEQALDTELDNLFT